MARTASASASDIGSTTTGGFATGPSAAPAAGHHPPLGTAAVSFNCDDRVEEVDDRADVVRDDGDDLTEHGPLRPVREGHDAVVVVDPLDLQLGIARDRPVPGEPRRPVLRQRLRSGVEDDP